MGNFKRDEFACQCGCGFNTVDFELINVLEEMRAYFDKPIYITSGSRCVSHNKSVGGSSRSQHLFGRACDFKVKDTHADIVADYLESKYQAIYGIGRYDGRTHVDTRSGTKARWDERVV